MEHDVPGVADSANGLDPDLAPNGGGTVERWNEDGSPPDVRGIADDHGRIMVVMVHNTDLPDPWEREGEESDYFFRFSPEAYAVGINILLYALTH